MFHDQVLRIRKEVLNEDPPPEEVVESEASGADKPANSLPHASARPTSAPPTSISTNTSVSDNMEDDSKHNDTAMADSSGVSVPHPQSAPEARARGMSFSTALTASEIDEDLASIR